MDEDLADLRWHYTGAYVIQHAAPDVWIAQRTDNNGTLRASTPDAATSVTMPGHGHITILACPVLGGLPGPVTGTVGSFASARKRHAPLA